MTEAYPNLCLFKLILILKKQKNNENLRGLNI